MNKSVRLVFFGNERLATAISTTAPTLQALVKNGYEVAAVITSHTPGVSRNQRRLEIVEVAHAYHIPVLIPGKLNDIADRLKNYGAEAAVLVAYGKILPKSIIDLFPRGIINIHPSLLPLYRGPSPIETAILDGAKESGVSLMRLSPQMDAGPVFTQKKIALSDQETKQTLADKLLEEGSKLLIDNLTKIIDGSLHPQPQDESQATYTKLLKKEDGIIDWSKPAEIIERQIRAFLGFPRSRAKVGNHEIVITRARVAKDEKDGALVIKCRPGYLEIQELIAPSGRSVKGENFLHGYRV